MQVVQVKVELLKPADYNPRQMTEKQAQDLTESIRRFGLVDPIIVNSHKGRKNTVIGGHQRLQVALSEGFATVPVVYVDLDPKRERELNLRLNKNLGQWDWDALAAFEQELLEEIGFDDKELDRIFTQSDAEDDFDAAKEAEAIVTPTAQIGDVYQLGEHRLVCGDSTDPKVIQQATNGEKVSLTFTDPPYNVNYSGDGKKTSMTIENDHMESKAFEEFLTKAFQAIALSVDTGAALYSCYASRSHREFENALNAAGFTVRNQIIWVKKVASMGWGDYRWKHEPILYCTRGDGTNFYGDRSQYTEWDHEMSDGELLQWVKAHITKEESGGSTVWRMHRDSNYDHPTQKPIKLVAIALRNSSQRKELVLDPFGGGGTTLVACENLGRRCAMVELDPRFVDVIIKRWEKLTGGKAEKV
jgi:DNA modification methylase